MKIVCQITRDRGYPPIEFPGLPGDWCVQNDQAGYCKLARAACDATPIDDAPAVPKTQAEIKPKADRNFKVDTGKLF